MFERASESISLKLSPNKQVMLIGVVQLLGAAVATAIVEKTGRKVRIFINLNLAIYLFVHVSVICAMVSPTQERFYW